METHTQKECSVKKYKRRTHPNKISKEIANEYALDTLQKLLKKLSIDEQSRPSFVIGNIIASPIKKHSAHLQTARLWCTSTTKRKQLNTCMTVLSIVRVMSSWHLFRSIIIRHYYGLGFDRCMIYLACL